MRRAHAWGIAAVVLAAAAQPAVADPVADFYAGKRVTLVVAAAAGGPYDLCARLLAGHLADHIPGHPAIVVEDMSGASGILAADYLYNRAPQDGTVLGNLHNMLPMLQVLGQLTPRVDPAKFNWIGNMTRETGVVVVSAKTPVKTIEDAKRIPLTMGAAAPGALAAIYPAVMDHVLGTKFRVVTGYGGFAGVEHALEEGEVDGNAGDTWYDGVGETYDLYKAGKIRVLLEIGAKSPGLGDLPVLADLASDPQSRDLLELFSSPYAVGKPTAVGPKVPPERVAALRAAYDATIRDPAFLAEAQKFGIVIAPTSGPDLAALVNRLTTLPPELAARARIAAAP